MTTKNIIMPPLKMSVISPPPPPPPPPPFFFFFSFSSSLNKKIIVTLTDGIIQMICSRDTHYSFLNFIELKLSRCNFQFHLSGASTASRFGKDHKNWNAGEQLSKCYQHQKLERFNSKQEKYMCQHFQEMRQLYLIIIFRPNTRKSCAWQ